jgi:hypothetical protein
MCLAACVPCRAELQCPGKRNKRPSAGTDGHLSLRINVRDYAARVALGLALWEI